MTMERMFTLQCDGQPCEEYTFDSDPFSGALWKRALKQGWKKVGSEHFCPWCYETRKLNEGIEYLGVYLGDKNKIGIQLDQTTTKGEK